MARRRLRRDAQVEHNRGLLLAAARRVFLARGFHGATLDAIAEAAGFSKGVVYSQFDSKADLFLALLEERIAERAAENERIARRASGAAAVTALFALGERRARGEVAWNLLLLEFRAQATRDPALNERYAKLHARTVEALAALLTRLFDEARVEPPWPPATIATLVFAISTGANLENLVAPGSLPADAIAGLLTRALGIDEEAS